MRKAETFDEKVELLAKHTNDPHKVCPDCLVISLLNPDLQAKKVKTLRRLRQVCSRLRPPLSFLAQLHWRWQLQALPRTSDNAKHHSRGNIVALHQK